LRGKIMPDEAESKGCGGSTVEDDNEVWPDFARNPKGEGGPFFDFWGRLLRPFVAKIHPVFVAPHSSHSKNLLLSLPS